MVKISHEIPLSLVDKHQSSISDYMFVLLHKCMEDKDYLQKAIDYKLSGGELFLDNSCFELGESLDNDVLYEYYNKLNPDIVIIPDVLGDKDRTLERSIQFLKDYPIINNAMAVAQGSTPDELIECYKAFRDYRDARGNRLAMIGIPFVYAWEDKFPASQSEERIRLLRRMVREGVIDETMRHHLLGTWQAREFAFYTNYNWIYSIDTSNPIMAAIDNMKYSEYGLGVKPKSTFDKVYHLKEVDFDMDLLYYNVYMFKEIVNGKPSR